MRTGVGVLLCLLVLAGTAMAAPGQLDVRSDLPLEFRGERQVQTTGGAYLVEGDQGDVDLRIDAEEGTLTRVVHRAFGYVRPDDPQLEVTWTDRVERHRLDLQGATVVLQERHDGFRLLLHDAALQVDDHGPATYIGALQEPKTIESEVPRAFSMRVDGTARAPFGHDLPAGLFQARTTSGTATADTLQAYLYGGEVRVDADGRTQVLEASFREEQRPGAVYDPVAGRWTGPGEHTEYVHEYLLLDIQDGHLDLMHHALPATIYDDALDMQVTGDAVLPAAHGRLVIEDEETVEHLFDGQDVALSGRFTLTAAGPVPGYERAGVHGEGDWTQVSYGAVAAEYDWTATAVVAGLGTLVAIGAAWLLGQGKPLAALGGGLVAGYARVQGEGVLQHDARSQVYELVKAHPGGNFHDLAKQVPFGDSTLNYHLRVLEKNGFVNRVKDGRYVRFFDRRSGEYSGERKFAASALRNPTTAAIAEAIVARPGVAQCDLADAFGLAASTINWHVHRLSEAGLVERRRQQHYTRYYAGDAWASLPMHEQARHGLAVA